MWWWAYFCLMVTGLLTKWAGARISRWPTVAADSLGGPFWGLGGTGLWTRDLCCLFTFSWFSSPWLTAHCCVNTLRSIWIRSFHCVYIKGLRETHRQKDRGFSACVNVIHIHFGSDSFHYTSICNTNYTETCLRFPLCCHCKHKLSLARTHPAKLLYVHYCHTPPWTKRCPLYPTLTVFQKCLLIRH